MTSPNPTRPSSPHPTRRSVLTRPRSPVIEHALGIARDWCAGQIIDGAPALGHAVRVALTLGRHLPAVPPELTAAILLHDVLDYRGSDLVDSTIARQCGQRTLTMVWLMYGEHTAMDSYGAAPAMALRRLERLPDLVAAALTADKIVSVGYVLRGAQHTADPAAYWPARRPFLDLVPYLRAFHTATAHRIPTTLAGELDTLVRDAETATT
ncbi:conserved hypothetical protein [Frankia canadensis]|uniref:HD domain-containing protein n=1 Tax=Frankia canadensis TaxID=1836972 RepID=A0A2I2KN54_9ACTN|nr:hypothetical protein [Frankia canadensis]SNQ47072.1 conserved hypothetical protein [Frankia canadensis]SOU54362.1 conserved hypothetical protein [Frankia canadensis]